MAGSRLAQRARDEAEEARTRQYEVEVLFSLSRDLLQTESVAELVNVSPELITGAAGAETAVLYLLVEPV